MGVTSPLVLFSEVHGTVLRNGTPVAGAEITQEVVWSDNKDDIAPRSVTTRADGAFHFAALEKAPGALRLVPHQATVLQKLLIRHEGVEYTGWRHTRNSYQANSELGGRPIRLVCELSSEPDFEGKHYGICREG